MYHHKHLSQERLLDEEFENDSTTHRPPNLPKYRKLEWAFQFLFFLGSLTLFLSGLHQRQNPPAKCADGDFTPQWSPALEAVQNTGYTTRFDGSFAKSNAFKGTPSPEIDRSWNDITYLEGGVISIDEATLLTVNASREFSVELAPEIGGGYMASVEVLHQLHCLDMLRQVSYEDYYKDKAAAWKDTPQILRWHLDHCIDNLRQKLMCEADTGILTYVWVKGHPAPFPDFNVQHTCRSFDAVKNWVRDRQVFTKDEFVIERQPGAQERESPP